VSHGRVSSPPHTLMDQFPPAKRRPNYRPPAFSHGHSSDFSRFGAPVRPGRLSLAFFPRFRDHFPPLAPDPGFFPSFLPTPLNFCVLFFINLRPVATALNPSFWARIPSTVACLMSPTRVVLSGSVPPPRGRDNRLRRAHCYRVQHQAFRSPLPP